jgi:hypothetical protein
MAKIMGVVGDGQGKSGYFMAEGIGDISAVILDGGRNILSTYGVSVNFDEIGYAILDLDRLRMITRPSNH